MPSASLDTSTIVAYLKRAGLTFIQAFLSSIVLTELITSVEKGDLSALERIGLAGLGAASAALVSFLKNVAFQPTEGGIVGLLERVVSTFVEGAAAAIPIQLLVSDITGTNLHGLEALALAAVNGGIAAVLSLIQHLGNLPAAPGAAAALPPRPPKLIAGTDAPRTVNSESAAS